MRYTARKRGGLTLLELLVAMSILLVGIYAVARGFPSLFGNLDQERIRTQMITLAAEQLERLKADPERLPEAIAGHDPITGLVFRPDIFPDESTDPTPANPRDDLTWVLGESFRVPGLQPGQTIAVYPLNLGLATVQDPANVSDYLQVFRLARLRRVEMTQQDWETAGRPLDDDQFFLDNTGHLYAPSPYAVCRVNYAWADTDGVAHWVDDEVVQNVNYDPAALPVRAADLTSAPAFANVIPEMSLAKAMTAYSVVIGQPADVVPGTAVLEGNFGATLLLPAGDAGAVMHVNYQLRTEQDSSGAPRRLPVVMEEFTAPTQAPYEVSLKLRGVDTDQPLFASDLLGNPLGAPAYALLVDMLTGASYTDAADWITLEPVEGKLTLDWDNAAAPMTATQAKGREFRVYYRTLDGNMVTVQKAPDYFLERPIEQTYVNSDPTLDESDKVDYRYYTVQPAPGDPTYTQLVFPESAAGQSVTVDYLAGASAPRRRVSGELHVVDATDLSITLSEPVDAAAVGIISVHGVSVTVKGWWHDNRGRVKMVELGTFLTPEPLL